MNLALAKHCLRLSARAYHEATVFDATTSTEALLGGIVSEPESLIIAFRGTNEPRDFIMDAKFLGKRSWVFDADVHVHRGFDAGWFGVANQVINRVKGIKRIIVTGHSLGGARAILCAAHLYELGLPVTDVITFGCPRVGNGAFRDYYNAKLHNETLRFEAQGDPVPWTPPWLLNGYRHVGRAVYLRASGEIVVDPPLWAFPLIYSETLIEDASDEQKQLLGFGAHALANYEKLFAQLEVIA
jgi:predicted lipase